MILFPSVCTYPQCYLVYIFAAHFSPLAFYISKILLQINGSCRTFKHIEKRQPSNFDRNSINVLFNMKNAISTQDFLSVYLSIYLSFTYVCWVALQPPILLYRFTSATANVIEKRKERRKTHTHINPHMHGICISWVTSDLVTFIIFWSETNETLVNPYRFESLVTNTSFESIYHIIMEVI